MADKRFIRRKIAVLAGGIAMTVLAMTADALTRHIELDDAWTRYAGTAKSTSPAYRFPHARCFKAAATAHGIPETLLLAVARGESDFDADARSKANAHGVMQIQWPGTAKHLGIDRLSELYKPCINIDAGTRYLKELIGRYDGNVHLALAAYNYGPSRITPHGTLPSGAIWYSGYIHRHLQYVLGDGSSTAPQRQTLYSDIGQSTLLTFGEPYRAEAFIDQLESLAPNLHLDWFRRGTGEFEVVITYADRDEFDRSAQQLRAAGYQIN